MKRKSANFEIRRCIRIYKHYNMLLMQQLIYNYNGVRDFSNFWRRTGAFSILGLLLPKEHKLQ